MFDLNVDDTDKKQNMIKQLHKILRCVGVYSRTEGAPHDADGVSRSYADVFVWVCNSFQ